MNASAVQNPVWRKGMQRLFVVDAPPAGQDFRIKVPTVPEGEWWRLKTAAFRFTTSAVVANRTPRLAVYASDPQGLSLDGAYYLANSGLLQAAGITGRYFAAEVGQQNTAFSTVFQWPYELLIQPGHVIETFTGGLDVGDQYDSIVLLVQEMIYVPAVDMITGALSKATDRIIAAIAASAGKCAFTVEGGAVGAPTPTPQ